MMRVLFVKPTKQKMATDAVSKLLRVMAPTATTTYADDSKIPENDVPQEPSEIQTSSEPTPNSIKICPDK
jgi:hypothetical protein